MIREYDYNAEYPCLLNALRVPYSYITESVSTWICSAFLDWIVFCKYKRVMIELDYNTEYPYLLDDLRVPHSCTTVTVSTRILSGLLNLPCIL